MFYIEFKFNIIQKYSLIKEIRSSSMHTMIVFEMIKNQMKKDTETGIFIELLWRIQLKHNILWFRFSFNWSLSMKIRFRYLHTFTKVYKVILKFSFRGFI